jgi:transaldolase
VGVTSNPTIFQKAITGSDHYDRQIQDLARPGRRTRGSPAHDHDLRRALGL